MASTSNGSPKYDVIVIGGGHNGLTNAAYLARAGKKVLVLERRHVLGGAAVTEEVFPGFKFSVCSYVVSLLRPEIIRDLDLPRHGLEILPLDGTFTPMPNGDYLWRVNDHGKTHREIARHSKVDAEAYDEFGKAMQAMCRFVKPILSMVPPDPSTLNPRELMKLLFLGKRFQGLASEDKYNQVQLMTMSAIDFLDQWFETDVLKATMSASGIIGTFLGVRSPGTAYVLLHHYMGEIDGAFRSWGFARGGTGAISNAIADAAREAGAEIRTQAPIARIIVNGNRAQGVVLQNGDEIYGDVISSSVDPRLTFIKFIEEKALPTEFLDDVRRYKFRGSSGKVNIALDALPDFKCLPGPGAHLRGAISISPSVEYMERAYDDAKYGNFSRRPYIDMVIPSLTDPSVAPPGKHVMSCFVQYAPYKLRPGLNWDEQREAFGNTVIDTISEYAPNFKNIILNKQVLTPLDLERDFGLSEGNIFQGELSLEQLFFLRPVPGYAQFRTPIKNLYMCGSATHPGGGIMGAPGRLAALEILKDVKTSTPRAKTDRIKNTEGAN
ncbi:MAG TPA: NAD(P)/FAD-dependent oxidoreductase [Candidatus Angelobacter sp.]|nr:NAD(P)/FAD-dependent oxidoreductase [Candidatus Angelobacter sp.]